MSNVSDKSCSASKKLPSLNGMIDWDRVAENYFDYILSPYAEEMVAGCQQSTSRNLLLNYLFKLPDDQLNAMRVLDVGCGPGNLIPLISQKIRRLTGLDISKKALAIAHEKANQHAVDFQGILQDILNYSTQDKFDVIISSNSILPNDRREVIEIFKKLADLLTDGGKIIAILPSFDTTLYLKQLRDNYFDNNSETVVMDLDKLAYADDGHHLQCYHTADSIINEAALSGLTLTYQPQKVYYPWSLCRQYGYGDFPQADEEIWDWFIVARKSLG